MEGANPTIEVSDGLVRQAVSGDEPALCAILGIVGPQVGRRLKIGSAYQSTLDIADVMQVTYLEAFLRIGDLQTATMASFTLWLTRIADNNLRDAIKELKRDRRPHPHRRVSAYGEGESSVELLAALGWCSSTPSRQAAIHEAEEILKKALTHLPESYERVLRLYELNALAPQEVARKMGRSVGAVYMLRTRALHRLAELIGPESKFFSDRV